MCKAEVLLNKKCQEAFIGKKKINLLPGQSFLRKMLMNNHKKLHGREVILEITHWR